jgi:hypothetical protein
MNVVPLSNVLAYSFLGISGISGGAALTTKLVNAEAGMVFLLFGGAWLTVGFIGLILLREYSRRRAIGNLLFVALGINVGGLLADRGRADCLFCWHPVLSNMPSLSSFHRMLGREPWRDTATLYNPALGVIHVEPLMRKLQINAELFLPPRLEFLSGMVSLGLILSMIIGLNLRNVYPVFSAFSWGIPALTLSTVLLQMAFLRILLAMKLRYLEKVLAPRSRLWMSMKYLD